MRSPLNFAVLVALSAFFPGGSQANGFSSNPTAPDGPNKLDECPCGMIYTKMLQCQKLKSGTDDCICIPNSEPDGCT